MTEAQRSAGLAMPPLTRLRLGEGILLLLTVLLGWCFRPGVGSRLLNDWRAMRDDRVNAGICPDSDEDLCAVGRPETTRTICKCDYECSAYGDCCMDMFFASETHVDTSWSCHERGFYAKRVCNPLWPRDEDLVRGLCERDDVFGEEHNVSYLQMVPVMTAEGSVMYWNVFCAACNGDAERLVTWMAQLLCDPKPIRTPERRIGPVTLFDAHVLTQILEAGGLRARRDKLVAIDRHERHNCVLDVDAFRWRNLSRTVRTCTQSLSRCLDASLAGNCSAYTAYVHDRITQRNYRNYHCALCDGSSRHRLACGGYVSPRQRDFDGWAAKQVSVQVELSLRRGVLPCREDQIRDPLLGACVPVGCAPGFFRFEDRCRSLADAQPDPFANVNVTHLCPVLRLDIQHVTILRNGSLLVNVTGQVYAPEQFVLVPEAHRNDTAAAALVCAGDRVSLPWKYVHILITRICLGISTVCLLIYLVAWVATPSLRSRTGKLGAGLATSLLVSQLCYLGEPIAVAFSKGCIALAIIGHYFQTASLCWVTALAADVHARFQALQMRSPPGSDIRRYCAFGWGAALVPVAVALALDCLQPDSPFAPLYATPACWMNRVLSVAAIFCAPAMTLLVVSAVLLCLSAPRLCAEHHQTKPAHQEFCRDRNRFLASTTLVVLTALTWTFPALGVSLHWDDLWYAFPVLWGIQGPFILLVYGCRRGAARGLLESLLGKGRGTGLRSAGVLVASTANLQHSIDGTIKMTAPYRRHLSDARKQSSPTTANMERRASNKRPLVLKEDEEAG